MKRLLLLAVPALLVAGLVAAGVPSSADGDSGRQDPNMRATLDGYNEVPAVSTVGNGAFSARIAKDGESFDWELTYAGLEAPSTQAHIHFGAESTNGGITVWLCSNLASPPTPAGVQACHTTSGTVTGTATAANVVGPTAQGITAGQLDEVITAMRSGVTYANVHSTTFPGGEIRGQIS